MYDLIGVDPRSVVFLSHSLASLEIPLLTLFESSQRSQLDFPERESRRVSSFFLRTSS